MKQHFLIAVTLIAVLFAATGSTRAARPDAPTYAKRGPFAVGTFDLTIPDPKRPLTVTVWYPALNPTKATEKIQYHFETLLVDGHALLNAKPDGSQGPYPLIVFSHGLGGLRLQSLFYTEHLASYGFVVMAADHPGSVLDVLAALGLGGSSTSQPTQLVENFALRPNDILREIAQAETLTAKGGALEGLIDTQRIAVTGHSFGGYTAMAAGGAQLDLAELGQWCNSKPSAALQPQGVCALRDYGNAMAQFRGLSATPQGVWPSTTDPRIKAVVALAPWNAPIFGKDGLAAFTVPALIIVGTTDTRTIPERDAYVFYDQIGSARKALFTLDNADHYVFVDNCPPAFATTALFTSCSDSVWDMDRVHDLINHVATAYLLATLKNDPDAAKAIAPGAVNFVGTGYKAQN